MCCKSIDAKSFEQIYIRYWDQVLQYAICIVHDESLAKDMVQHVFVSLWDKRKERQIEHIEIYLKRAVKYAALHEIKKDWRSMIKWICVMSKSSETRNPIRT